MSTSTSTSEPPTPDPGGIDIQTKTEVLLEALPYLQRFRNALFVVKFGGSFIDDARARHHVLTDLTFLSTAGIQVVLVHGGGKAISRAMERAQMQPVFRDGLRVTDAATAELVERTINSEVNAGLVEDLAQLQGRPLGVWGQEVFRCRRVTHGSGGAPIDLGFVGEVTAVQTDELQRQLQAGFVPVVSPVGRDSQGQFYNVNADAAASALACALEARRLVFLCDVPGLLRDPGDPASLISTLPVAEVDRLKAEGVIGRGMLPKVDSAVAALEAGVRRVHFIDGRLAHSLLLEIYTDRGIGTEIVREGERDANRT